MPAVDSISGFFRFLGYPRNDMGEADALSIHPGLLRPFILNSVEG